MFSFYNDMYLYIIAGNKCRSLTEDMNMHQLLIVYSKRNNTLEPDLAQQGPRPRHTDPITRPS